MRHELKIFYMANPALNRELDTGSMVAEAMDAIMHHKTFSRMLMLDPFTNQLWARATVTVAFPDPELLALGGVTPAHEGEVVRKQQLKVLSALDAATNQIKTGQRITYRNEEVKHEFAISRKSGSPEAGGNVLVEVVTLGVTLLDFRSIHLLKMLVETLLAVDALQLARDISLAVEVTGEIDGIEVKAALFDGKATRKPIPTWLVLERKPEVERFFAIPEVAAMIVDACRGMLVTADKMNDGAAVEKRRNVGGTPITIGQPRDVHRLMQEENLGAFYPSIERQDGLVGRLVADLDMGKGFVALLGAQRAWAACCKMSDAIVAAAGSVGMATPARRFSGSRGIHVVWNVDPDAFALGDDGEVAMAGYREAVLAVERKASMLESLRHLTRKPAFASKLYLQAVVLHGMHTRMDDAVLDDVLRQRLDISYDGQSCTLSREDAAAYQKVVVDCQPLVHRCLSPHHKTGLVARSIIDESGAIRDEYRRADRVWFDAGLARVADELPRRPDRYTERIGYVPAAVIGAACEPQVLGASIAMLLSRGVVACCNMAPFEYVESHDWYSRFIEGKR